MFTTRHDCALPSGHGVVALEPPASPGGNHMLETAFDQLRALAAHGPGNAPFASLALGLRGGHSAEVTKEHKTGVDFPESFCHLSQKDCPTLMGTG